jgi:hypothetical protein
MGRYQFRYPKDWHQFELADDRDGVMFSPQDREPVTWFSIWSTELEHKVLAEDLDLLREGVQEGLYQLPGLRVEDASERTFGNLIRFDRTFTFDQDGCVRKRRMQMLYVYKWQFVLIAQAESPDEFDYWRIMLNDFFNYFDLAEELWFASDPEVAADLG